MQQLGIHHNSDEASEKKSFGGGISKTDSTEKQLILFQPVGLKDSHRGLLHTNVFLKITGDPSLMVTMAGSFV